MASYLRSMVQSYKNDPVRHPDGSKEQKEQENLINNYHSMNELERMENAPEGGPPLKGILKLPKDRNRSKLQVPFDESKGRAKKRQQYPKRVNGRWVDEYVEYGWDDPPAAPFSYKGTKESMLFMSTNERRKVVKKLPKKTRAEGGLVDSLRELGKLFGTNTSKSGENPAEPKETEPEPEPEPEPELAPSRRKVTINEKKPKSKHGGPEGGVADQTGVSVSAKATRVRHYRQILPDDHEELGADDPPKAKVSGEDAGPAVLPAEEARMEPDKAPMMEGEPHGRSVDKVDDAMDTDDPEEAPGDVEVYAAEEEAGGQRRQVGTPQKTSCASQELSPIFEEGEDDDDDDGGGGGDEVVTDPIQSVEPGSREMTGAPANSKSSVTADGLSRSQPAPAKNAAKEVRFVILEEPKSSAPLQVGSKEADGKDIGCASLQVQQAAFTDSKELEPPGQPGELNTGGDSGQDGPTTGEEKATADVSDSSSPSKASLPKQTAIGDTAVRDGLSTKAATEPAAEAMGPANVASFGFAVGQLGSHKSKKSGSPRTKPLFGYREPDNWESAAIDRKKDSAQEFAEVVGAAAGQRVDAEDLDSDGEALDTDGEDVGANNEELGADDPPKAEGPVADAVEVAGTTTVSKEATKSVDGQAAKVVDVSATNAGDESVSTATDKPVSTATDKSATKTVPEGDASTNTNDFAKKVPAGSPAEGIGVQEEGAFIKTPAAPNTGLTKDTSLESSNATNGEGAITIKSKSAPAAAATQKSNPSPAKEATKEKIRFKKRGTSEMRDNTVEPRRKRARTAASDARSGEPPAASVSALEVGDSSAAGSASDGTASEKNNEGLLTFSEGGVEDNEEGDGGAVKLSPEEASSVQARSNKERDNKTDLLPDLKGVVTSEFAREFAKMPGHPKAAQQESPHQIQPQDRIEATSEEPPQKRARRDPPAAQDVGAQTTSPEGSTQESHSPPASEVGFDAMDIDDEEDLDAAGDVGAQTTSPAREEGDKIMPTHLEEDEEDKRLPILEGNEDNEEDDDDAVYPGPNQASFLQPSPKKTSAVKEFSVSQEPTEASPTKESTKITGTKASKTDEEGGALAAGNSEGLASMPVEMDTEDNAVGYGIDYDNDPSSEEEDVPAPAAKPAANGSSTVLPDASKACLLCHHCKKDLTIGNCTAGMWEKRGDPSASLNCIDCYDDYAANQTLEHDKKMILDVRSHEGYIRSNRDKIVTAWNAKDADKTMVPQQFRKLKGGRKGFFGPGAPLTLCLSEESKLYKDLDSNSSNLKGMDRAELKEELKKYGQSFVGSFINAQGNQQDGELFSFAVVEATFTEWFTERLLDCLMDNCKSLLNVAGRQHCRTWFQGKTFQTAWPRRTIGDGIRLQIVENEKSSISIVVSSSYFKDNNTFLAQAEAEAEAEARAQVKKRLAKTTKKKTKARAHVEADADDKSEIDAELDANVGVEDALQNVETGLQGAEKEDKVQDEVQDVENEAEDTNNQHQLPAGFKPLTNQWFDPDIDLAMAALRAEKRITPYVIKAGAMGQADSGPELVVPCYKNKFFVESKEYRCESHAPLTALEMVHPELKDELDKVKEELDELDSKESKANIDTLQRDLGQTSRDKLQRDIGVEFHVIENLDGWKKPWEFCIGCQKARSECVCCLPMIVIHGNHAFAIYKQMLPDANDKYCVALTKDSLNRKCGGTYKRFSRAYKMVDPTNSLAKRMKKRKHDELKALFKEGSWETCWLEPGHGYSENKLHGLDNYHMWE